MTALSEGVEVSLAIGTVTQRSLLENATSGIRGSRAGVPTSVRRVRPRSGGRINNTGINWETTYEVLLPVDSSEARPTPSSEAVAELPDAPESVRVTILNVFEEFDVYDNMGGTSSEALYDRVELPEGVSASADFLEGRGIDTDLRIEHGDPKEVIVDVAEELDADMIALGGRKQTPVGKVLFGSVTQAVLLSADRSVFVTVSE